MQYRFTKDARIGKKGQLLSPADENMFFLDNVLDLYIHTGILEEVKEEEWPKNGELYWFIDGLNFEVCSSHWSNSVMDRYRVNFLGIYRTKEEAEKARDDVREFIRNRNK